MLQDHGDINAIVNYEFIPFVHFSLRWYADSKTHLTVHAKQFHLDTQESTSSFGKHKIKMQFDNANKISKIMFENFSNCILILCFVSFL